MPHEILPLIDLPRYSIVEVERRWLVDPAAVGDLSRTAFRFYEDLYINGSRLRLRKITEPDGNVLFKLGRKYGKRSQLSEPITTLYLTEGEYQLLSCLTGYWASKRRYAVEGGFVDVYQRPTLVPMIFELEFKDETSAMRYSPPDFVTREITGDSNFSGFQLAAGHAA